MIIHHTAFQKKKAKFPTKVEIDSIAYRRGLIKSKEDVSAFRRLVAGHEGEQITQEYLQKYGGRDWIVIPNLWMNYFGNFECDLALFTHYKCYPLEVKNYYGDFIFNGGISTLDGMQLTVNPIFQARRAASNIKEILNRANLSVPVEGTLIFTGVDSYVDIQEKIVDLNIVTRTHLMHFIKQLVQEEKSIIRKPIQWHDIFPIFDKYERENSFGAKPYLKQKIQDEARKGISCEKCHSFNVDIKKYQVSCSCGHTESRQEAVIRTINEYGVLTFYEDFSLQEIINFCNNQVSRSLMYQILKQNFKQTGNSRYTLYSFKK